MSTTSNVLHWPYSLKFNIPKCYSLRVWNPEKDLCVHLAKISVFNRFDKTDYQVVQSPISTACWCVTMCWSRLVGNVSATLSGDYAPRRTDDPPVNEWKDALQRRSYIGHTQWSTADKCTTLKHRLPSDIGHASIENFTTGERNLLISTFDNLSRKRMASRKYRETSIKRRVPNKRRRYAGCHINAAGLSKT